MSRDTNGMPGARIQVLSPVARFRDQVAVQAIFPTMLDGKVVGILGNNKPNSAVFFQAVIDNNAYLDGDLLLVLGPEHAATVAADGWSKRDVKCFVYENARLPLHKLKLGGMWEMRKWPKWFNTVDGHAMIPIVEEPDDILVTVAGGEHSSFLPTVGRTRAVTRPIRAGG